MAARPSSADKESHGGSSDAVATASTDTASLTHLSGLDEEMDAHASTSGLGGGGGGGTSAATVGIAGHSTDPAVGTADVTGRARDATGSAAQPRPSAATSGPSASATVTRHRRQPQYKTRAPANFSLPSTQQLDDATKMFASMSPLGLGRKGTGTALMVVHAQNDFFEGGSFALDGTEHMLDVIRRLRRYEFDVVVQCRKKCPPNHVGFLSNNPGTTLMGVVAVPNSGPQKIWPDHCVQGTTGQRLHPGLVVRHTDLIVDVGENPSKEATSVLNPDLTASKWLLDVFKRKGITHVYVCGVGLDHAVAATAIDARKLPGVRQVIVVEDACVAIEDDAAVAAKRRLAMERVSLSLSTAREVERLPKYSLGQGVTRGRRRSGSYLFRGRLTPLIESPHNPGSRKSDADHPSAVTADATPTSRATSGALETKDDLSSVVAKRAVKSASSLHSGSNEGGHPREGVEWDKRDPVVEDLFFKLSSAVFRKDAAVVQSVVADAQMLGICEEVLGCFGAETGLTVLHSAAARGNAEIVRLLLAAGAQIHDQSKVDGSTALLIAIEAEASVAASVLLQSSKREALLTPNKFGVTPLIAACRNTDEPLVRRLLMAIENSGVDLWEHILHADNFGLTAMMATCTAARRSESRSSEWPSASTLALESSSEELGGQALMRRDSTTDAVRTEEVLRNAASIIGSLLGPGGSSIVKRELFIQTDDEQWSPLHYAAKSGVLSVIDWTPLRSGSVLRSLPCAASCRAGFTPLHLAVWNGRAAATAILLDDHAWPQRQNPWSGLIRPNQGLRSRPHTTLDLALMQGHTDCARVVVRAGGVCRVATARASDEFLHRLVLMGDGVALGLLLRRDENQVHVTQEALAMVRGMKYPHTCTFTFADSSSLTAQHMFYCTECSERVCVVCKEKCHPEEKATYHLQRKHRLTYLGVVSASYCGCKKDRCRAVAAVDDREAEGYKYVPNPIDTSGSLLKSVPGSELDELTTMLARNSHEVWARERQRQGWTYGVPRDNKLLKHPSLLPYAYLPKEDKLREKQTQLETLKVIDQMGFLILNSKGQPLGAQSTSRASKEAVRRMESYIPSAGGGSPKPPLSKILETPELLRDFEVFCTSSLCEENLFCYKDIQKFKRAATDKERLEVAEHLLNNYVKPGSKFMMNMSERDRAKIEAAVSDQLVPTDLFDALQTAAFNDLDRDVVPRFHERTPSTPGGALRSSSSAASIHPFGPSQPSPLRKRSDIDSGSDSGDSVMEGEKLLADFDPESVSAADLRLAAENFIPSPVETSKVQLSMVMVSLVELLARNYHEVYSDGKLKDGWKYTPNRAMGHSDKQSDMLVPYQFLTDAEKELSRGSAAELIKTMVVLGFEFRRQSDAPPVDAGLLTYKLSDAACDIMRKKNADLADIKRGVFNAFLFSAARRGRARLVETLLSGASGALGADIDCTDELGRTPLMWATMSGHRATTATLLAFGADVQRKDINGTTALMIAAYGDSEAACRLLLRHGADVTEADAVGLTALHYSAYVGSPGVCKLLAKVLAREGASVDMCMKVETPGAAQVTPKAAREAGIRLLSPLSLAVVGLHFDTCSALLAAGADPMLSIEGGLTPFQRANSAHSNAAAAVDRLRQKGDMRGSSHRDALLANGGEGGLATGQTEDTRRALEMERDTMVLIDILNAHPEVFRHISRFAARSFCVLSALYIVLLVMVVLSLVGRSTDVTFSHHEWAESVRDTLLPTASAVDGREDWWMWLDRHLLWHAEGAIFSPEEPIPWDADTADPWGASSGMRLQRENEVVGTLRVVEVPLSTAACMLGAVQGVECHGVASNFDLVGFDADLGVDVTNFSSGNVTARRAVAEVFRGQGGWADDNKAVLLDLILFNPKLGALLGVRLAWLFHLSGATSVEVIARAVSPPDDWSWPSSECGWVAFVAGLLQVVLTIFSSATLRNTGRIGFSSVLSLGFGAVCVFGGALGVNSAAMIQELFDMARGSAEEGADLWASIAVSDVAGALIYLAGILALIL